LAAFLHIVLGGFLALALENLATNAAAGNASFFELAQHR
jgi:hypothetical protein